MGRITVDVNEEWLEAARDVLGTDTKVATINAALRAFALRRQAAGILAAFDSVAMDFDGSGESWRYGGGRDLTTFEAEAQVPKAASWPGPSTWPIRRCTCSKVDIHRYGDASRYC